MSKFNLLKKAQLIDEVGNSLPFLEQVQEALGSDKTIFDAASVVKTGENWESIAGVENEESGVSKSDYTKWINAIKSIAKEEDVDISHKHAFDDLAFEILDNDPKLDAVGPNENNKRAIINILWKEYSISQAKNKAIKPSEENEEHAVNFGSHAAYREGYKAVIKFKKEGGKHPSNPYTHGTKRYHAWTDGFKDGK